ncbi:hypothetical protein PVAP13_9NG498528 [Panicum virgatum]|uniref:Uncharacterized protein n=1 Tax=Panicum virgatum TaxID=38727 RepID=A0A8T0MRW3_PANVG|nr:hypothetical protein PVAP13_9NG498528 [Panicum virgatum]
MDPQDDELSSSTVTGALGLGGRGRPSYRLRRPALGPLRAPRSQGAARGSRPSACLALVPAAPVALAPAAGLHRRVRDGIASGLWEAKEAEDAHRAERPCCHLSSSRCSTKSSV